MTASADVRHCFFEMGAWVQPVIGWGSSAILCLTVITQVLRQWRTGTSEGISPWFFIGQFAASTGLLVYSIHGQQWVFVALNVVMLAAAACGYFVYRLHRRAKRKREAPSRRAAVAPATGHGPSTCLQFGLQFGPNRSAGPAIPVLPILDP